MDDAVVYMPSVLSKDRERLIEHDAVIELLNQVLQMVHEQDLLSGIYYSVDCTLIQVWVNHKSILSKEDMAVMRRWRQLDGQASQQ
jgi:hypothetical protein